MRLPPSFRESPFFLQVPSPGIAGLGAPPVGEPQLPQPSTHPPPIPSFSASPCVSPLPPCASAVRACACNLLAGPASDHRQSLKILLLPVTAIPGARLGTVRCHFEPLKKQHRAVHRPSASKQSRSREGMRLIFYHQMLKQKLNMDWQHIFFILLPPFFSYLILSLPAFTCQTNFDNLFMLTSSSPPTAMIPLTVQCVSTHTI
jgi:hypothetical protein